MIKKFYSMVCLILFFIIGSVVFLYADFKMVWKYKDGAATIINYKNKHKALLTFENRDSTVKYYIKGKKTYMVTEEDGNVVIQDMDELKNMIGRFGYKNNNEANKTKDKKYEYKLIRKKKNVKVNGIKGERWIVKYFDFLKNRYVKEEVVITRDKHIIKAMNKYIQILKKITPVESKEIFKDSSNSNFVVIKDKNSYLAYFDRRKISERLFRLPRKGKVEHANLKKKKSNQTKRYVEKKEEKAENSIKRKADEKVDEVIEKGINNIFKSIFK